MKSRFHFMDNILLYKYVVQFYTYRCRKPYGDTQPFYTNYVRVVGQCFRFLLGFRTRQVCLMLITETFIFL